MDFSEFERCVTLGHSRAFVARNIRGQVIDSTRSQDAGAHTHWWGGGGGHSDFGSISSIC